MQIKSAMSKKPPKQVNFVEMSDMSGSGSDKATPRQVRQRKVTIDCFKQDSFKQEKAIDLESNGTPKSNNRVFGEDA